MSVLRQISLRELKHRRESADSFGQVSGRADRTKAEQIGNG